MTPDDLFDEFVAGFPARKFSAGLLIAFVDFLHRLAVRDGSARNLADVLAAHPRQAVTAAGKRANTLIVATGSGSTLSLRPFYNDAETFFRATHKRFDYPSCAPHATQAWSDYLHWLDALVRFDSDDRLRLRDRVVEFTLNTLSSHAFDPTSVRTEPPLFQRLLDSFEMTARKGEPTGAAFQGIVFGFLRADNPHLQIEIDKVRTGSKRLQRVGDIDAWEGARLALSAEVKQFKVERGHSPDFEAFANDTGRRGALGIVACLAFGEGARQRFEDMGLHAVDLDDLCRIVELWDPFKQRVAAASVVYYAHHVEKNAALRDRLDEFLRQAASSD